MITLKNINLSSIALSGIDLRGIKLGLGGRGGGSGDGFPRLPGDVTRWSFKGLTNEQMSKNPRLEDADHKGRFLTFKNFAWGGMSGCGGYSLSKETFSYTPDIYSFNFTDPEGGLKIFDIYFQLIGLEENSGVTFNLDIIESGTAKRIKRETYTKGGIYHFEYKSEDDATKLYMIGYNGNGGDRTTFTVKILPYYPGFIIGDGVDDYAVTEKNLDFEDTYTVYTAFIPFETPIKYPVLCGKDYKKDFYINYIGDTLRIASFYSSNKPVYIPILNGFNILCCKRTLDKIVIKNLITGMSSEVSVDALIDNPGLYYLWVGLVVKGYAKAAIAGQIIDNGHFTTDEEDSKVLAWYKKEYPWLFFDQAWTVTGKTNEDTNRATITNITGNGNNLVLSNFGFAENSGYGEWSISFPSNLTIDQPYGTLHFREGRDYANVVYRGTGKIEIKFKIRGLAKDRSFAIRAYNKDTAQQLDYKNYTENNTYTYAFESSEEFTLYIYNGVSPDLRSDFYVDVIPDHEGYLVTDGVDDKAYSSAFILGKKFTVVGENKILSNTYANAGIVKVSSFFVFPNSIGVTCYINRQSKGLAIPSKRLKSICSDGRIYYDDWAEAIDVGGNMESNNPTPLFLGYQNNEFTRFAFKNLAIYNNKTLSKEDAIKAYIYLQTLKAK